MKWKFKLLGIILENTSNISPVIVNIYTEEKRNECETKKAGNVTGAISGLLPVKKDIIVA